MKILIVEDLQHKVDELTKFLKATLSQVEIVAKMSYNSGLEEVVNKYSEYDLILLDMSMQNYDITKTESGGDPMNLAGMHILDQMYYKEIKKKVIVVTMYENFGEGGKTRITDLDRLLSEDFSDNYLGYVFFSTSDDSWKENLHSLIANNFEI